MDERLLEATTEVLAEWGWDGVTLERVAARAGRSRVTLWRQGITREQLLDALLARLADDFRATMRPVLTSRGTGYDRLVRSADALFDVLDRHLYLVLASDTIFHQTASSASKVDFLEPFERFLREGTTDGSLELSGPVDDVADVLMNALTWTYVHMRGRHRWARRRARRTVADLVLAGLERAHPDEHARA